MIPVISSLLIGGVPLAPVMSFWIASPSMDPEIFILSSSVIGWKLAVWRLASTFIISLLSGYITHFATVKGCITSDVLKTNGQKASNISLKSFLIPIRSFLIRKRSVAKLVPVNAPALNNICCSISADPAIEKCGCSDINESDECNCNDPDNKNHAFRWERVPAEIIRATFLVTKFMGLAFFITALITFYLPEDVISGIVSANPSVQVVLATMIGIPMYTSNITALPLTGGLIELGLNKGAALSFLIAGATTTLPAMVAVWGITKRRVFFLYLGFALFGALLAGLSFNLFG